MLFLIIQEEPLRPGQTEGVCSFWVLSASKVSPINNLPSAPSSRLKFLLVILWWSVYVRRDLPLPQICFILWFGLAGLVPAYSLYSLRLIFWKLTYLLFCVPPPEAEVNEGLEVYPAYNDAFFLHFGTLCACDHIIIYLKLRKESSTQDNVFSYKQLQIWGSKLFQGRHFLKKKNNDY